MERVNIPNPESFTIPIQKPLSRSKKKNKDIIDNLKGILISDAVKKTKTKVTSASLKKYCYSNSIKVKYIKIDHIERAYIDVKDFNKIKDLDFENIICPTCGSKFKKTRKNRVYCSDRCRNLKNARDCRDGKTNKDIGIKLMKGREDNKKIMNCSVECLLDELGDIE